MKKLIFTFLLVLFLPSHAQITYLSAEEVRQELRQDPRHYNLRECRSNFWLCRSFPALEHQVTLGDSHFVQSFVDLEALKEVFTPVIENGLVLNYARFFAYAENYTHPHLLRQVQSNSTLTHWPIRDYLIEFNSDLYQLLAPYASSYLIKLENSQNDSYIMISALSPRLVEDMPARDSSNYFDWQYGYSGLTIKEMFPKYDFQSSVTEQNLEFNLLSEAEAKALSQKDGEMRLASLANSFYAHHRSEGSLLFWIIDDVAVDAFKGTVYQIVNELGDPLKPFETPPSTVIDQILVDEGYRTYQVTVNLNLIPLR